jgi:hypothetical protein
MRRERWGNSPDMRLFLCAPDHMNFVIQRTAILDAKVENRDCGAAWRAAGRRTCGLHHWCRLPRLCTMLPEVYTATPQHAGLVQVSLTSLLHQPCEA